MLEYKNRELASDIEAIGFYEVIHSAKDIHCLCSVDVKTDEVLLFHDYPEYDGVEVVDPYDDKTYVIPKRVGTLQEGIEFWGKAANNGSKLIIHNSHTYDRPVIDKVWPDNGIPFESYHDTFIQSKVQWYERPCPKGAKSAHGLKAYGIKCGVNKPEITDWSTMDAFKLHRVVEDCRIQAATYKMLQKERKFLFDTFGIDFTQALKIEALYAHECFRQEVKGVKVDVEHIKRCIKDLDEKIETLREEIEPNLPPTLKGTGGKVSRKEIAELLGFNPDRVKDNYVERRRNGEVETVVEKPYFKPSTNFTKVEKCNLYVGFHISHGVSPCFRKKKELTDWIKKEHPDTKPKEWEIDKEETKKELLNKNTCDYFGLNPEDTDIVCGPFTRISIEPSRMTQSDVVKSYLVQLGWKDAEDWNLKTDVNGDYIKVDKETVVRWPESASPEHQLVKVIPKGGYMVSSPKLSENDFEQLPEGIGKKIGEYNTYQHRRRFLENPKDPENKGLLSYVRDDGRIPAGVNNFATRSGRCSQRIWVNAPGKKSLYGKEIRSCIVAEEGKSLVGIDMKSAQLSIAAYYANNEEYYNNVATGEEKDANGVYKGESGHCVNARMFGMVSEQEWRTAVETQDPAIIERISIVRDRSKGGSFATLFGASGKKVGSTIGIPESEGNARKKQFLDQMGLTDTIKMLEIFEKKYPYKGGFMLPLAFGYWLWNNSSHKSLNTIVQGFEALAQKLAVVRVAKEMERVGLDKVAGKVLDYMDEMLFEVDKGYEEQVGTMIGDAYKWAAEQIYKFHLNNPEHFANFEPPKFYIDLNGGFDVGNCYYDCH